MPALPPASVELPLSGPITPGDYLMRWRGRRGLNRYEVASLIPTDSRLDHRQRVAWLREVEANTRGLVRSADREVMALLGVIYGFDPGTLWQLVAIQAGAEIQHPALCRLCYCGWTDACVEGARPCRWSTTDVSICTACETHLAAAAARPALVADLAPGIAA